MDTPLVSVVICVYNAERYLSEAIESVLSQTYKNIEVVVVDDGSKDASVSIIESYTARDARIKLFIQENQGLAAARNMAFRHSYGEWIAIIDQDDLCYPERIQRQVDLASSNQKAELIFSDTNYIDKDGVVTGTHLRSFTLPAGYIPRGEAANLLLSQGCYIDSEALFIKKEASKRIGDFDISLRYACDYDYFIRAGFLCDFAYTEEILSAWRRHPNQETQTNFKRFKETKAVLHRYERRAETGFMVRCDIKKRLTRLAIAEMYHDLRRRIAMAAK